MTEARRTDRLLGAAAVVAVIAPIVAALLATRGHRWFPTADDALIELQTKDVPQHLPLVGAYSRFGFHHPGPAEYLALTVPYHVLGPSGLLVGAALLNGAAVGGTMLYLFRRGGRVLMAGGVVAMLAIEHAVAEQLLDPWNTWLGVLPFAFAIVLAWSVWCRDWWALPILVVVVSFVVQVHIGYAIPAAWLLVSAVAVAGLSHRAGGRLGARFGARLGTPCRPRVLVVSLGAAAAAWALPVIGQFRQSPGNLSLIFDYFTGTHDPTVGATDAVAILAREWGVTAPWLGGGEPVAAYTAGVEGSSALFLLPLVVAFGTTMVLAGRAARRTESEVVGPARDAVRFQWVLIGAALAGFVSVARITDEPFAYLFRWLWVIGALCWLSTVWSGWTAWKASTAERTPAATGEPWASSIRLVVVVIVIGAVSIWASARATGSPTPNPQYSAAVDALIDPVSEAVRGQGNVLVTGEGKSFHEVQTGMVAELDRRGLPVVVADGEGFFFGDPRTAQGRPIDARLVVAVNEAVAARQRAGSVPIATYDPLTPAERAELDAIAARYTRPNDEGPGLPGPGPVTAADVARGTELRSRGHLVAVYLEPGPPPA